MAYNVIALGWAPQPARRRDLFFFSPNIGQRSLERRENYRKEEKEKSVISSAYISRIFCNDCVPHPAPPAEEESGARASGCLCVVDSNPIRKANVSECLCVLSLAGE